MKTLEEIGQIFDVTRERIRQIEVRIKRRLKTFLQQELGEEINFEFDMSEA